jgi:hypothetical protein
MAWTEQCRVAFKANADVRVCRGESVSAVLKALSEESEIPLGTLNRWYYRETEQSYSKNAVTPNQTTQGEEGTESEKWPLCSECGRKHVEKAYKDGRPHKSGLCWSCRREKAAKKKADEERREFLEIPVSKEAEECWQKIADKLSELIESAVIGKVGCEVLEMVLGAQSDIYAIITELVEVSTYKSESG